MVTVVMVEKRPPRFSGEERRRAPRSARPKVDHSHRPAQPPGNSSAEDALAGTPWTAPSPDPLSSDERFRRISLCAYYRAEQRGFAPGHMWEDWLAAEREVDAAAAAPPA
jgi:hypothetical protein